LLPPTIIVPSSGYH